MDTIQFRLERSIFANNKWFKPDWKNKYKQPLTPGTKTWYYIWLYKPVYKEKFPYSTTALVFTTDAWHFFQWVFLTCMQMGYTFIIYYLYGLWWWIASIIAVKIMFGAIFELFYNKLFIHEYKG